MVNKVLEKVTLWQETGELHLPANYSVANALRSAWLILLDTTDKNGKPVLEVCTKASIANSLQDMILKGLSPVKKQCYFVAYGNELSCDESYFGDQVMAKRVGDVKEFISSAVYDGDEFKWEKNMLTGRTSILEHKQDIARLDHEKVVGAYVIVVYNDGTTDAEVMSIKQIRQSWLQGAAKGQSPAHKNFTDEMACKTVIGRKCKKITNGTDDTDLYQKGEGADRPSAQVSKEIVQGANKTAISMGNPPPKPKALERVYTQPEPEAAPMPETAAVTDEPPY